MPSDKKKSKTTASGTTPGTSRSSIEAKKEIFDHEQKLQLFRVIHKLRANAAAKKAARKASSSAPDNVKGKEEAK
jgi:hypothetical protein